MSYLRFAAMIAASSVIMLGLMYVNTFLFSHVFWSETRAYMAILMGAAMAIIMLAFMLSMYSSRAINAAIFIGAAVAFAVALWLVRSQITVGDTSYMRAMIPHHSIAIMTSSRARISDPRVRKLADEIVYAQDKEIAEMRYLINDIDASGDGTEQESSAPTRIVSLEEALATAEIGVLDPEFMTEEEIGQLFPTGPACTFTYTTGSPPVLAISPRQGGVTGLVKISGDLVQLNAESAEPLPALGAGGISLLISAADGSSIPQSVGADPTKANLELELDAGLRAGYRGFYSCNM